MGETDPDYPAEKQWVEIELVITAIKTFSKVYKIKIPILEFEGGINKEDNALYIMDYEAHCFLILYKVGQGCFVAGPGNSYLNDKDIKKEIDLLLEMPAHGVKFDYKPVKGQCGSESVC